jgi:hypothetical protein
LRRLAKSPAPLNATAFLTAICRIAGSPISSPLSQNAAALLFDLCTVDIRRVGTQIQANARRGVFRVKHKSCHQAFAANDDVCPSLGENDMKEATKRAASEALAQTLAVTAMLVIAGFIFYVR